jgi:hypothetical protein
MDELTRKALDGELPRDRLDPAQAADLAAAEAEIAAVLRAVPMQPLPDLAPAVMRRIEQAAARAPAVTPAPAAHAAPLRALFDWIWNPRPLSIRWRPAYGFAAAAVVLFAVVLGRETAPAPHASQQVLTQFLLSAPDAQQVALAGDFTDWQPAHVLTRSEPGVWTVVVPLSPGVHDYAFIVDGERWVPDPNAPAVADGFGGLNSRLAVLAPDDAEL